MHPVQIVRTVLKRLFDRWISPAERAVHVAHGIEVARRRAARRPLPRHRGRPLLRVIQGGKSLRTAA